MIIADAFRKLFDGMPVDITSNGQALSTTLKFGYGNQKELLRWVDEENKRTNPDKYPLLWYVLNDYTEFDGVYTTNVTFFLMTNTREEVTNNWRTTNNYIGVLQPVWKKVQETIELNGFVEVMGSQDSKYRQLDFPNYGVNKEDVLDMYSKKPQAEKSLTLDFVDAKSIEFKALIRVNCIN